MLFSRRRGKRGRLNLEVAFFVNHYNLDNIRVIFDVNRFGHSEPSTLLAHNVHIYRKRLEAFDFNAVVDRHDIEKLSI